MIQLRPQPPLILIQGALLSLFLGCQPRGEAPAHGSGAPIEVLAPTEIGTIDPRFSTRALDVKISRLVHAGLIGLDPASSEPVPLLAERWRWENSTRLFIQLRPGLRFHSGRPLEVADICETISALSDPQLGSPHRVVVSSIGSCEKLSELTLALHLREPRATLLSDLEVPILRADQARLPQDTRGTLDGLGAYRVTAFDWTEVKLSPVATRIFSSTAHEQRPAPSQVVVRTVRDENARVLRLMAGRADIAPNTVSPSLLPALEGTEGTKGPLKVVSRPGANTTYLLFQNDSPPTRERAIRRAVGQAIDRELIIQNLLAGQAQIAAGIFPQGHWSADPSAAPLPYALKEATTELRGVSLSISTSTDRARLTIARAIAQMLRDAGAEVRVIALDLGVLLRRLDLGDFQLAILQMPELTEPNLLSWFFHPRGIFAEGGEGRNRARYRSIPVGNLLDEASREPSQAARAALYQRIAQQMAHDLPVLPLWHEHQVSVVSERASSFQLSAIGRWDALQNL